jgi:hypothetical protein
MKNDLFIIQISQQTSALLESFKINLNDLAKLNEEQVKLLKESMVNYPGHDIFNHMKDQ